MKAGKVSPPPTKRSLTDMEAGEVEAETTLEGTMSAHQSEFTPAHWVGQTSLGSPELKV